MPNIMKFTAGLLASLACAAVAAPAQGKDLIVGGSEAPDAPLVIAGIRAVDLSGDKPAIGVRVAIFIEDGVITYFGPESSIPPTGGAKVILADGYTALPGLADMHVHVWDEAELGAYLAHGVTTVRNMSGMPFHLTMQERIYSGELLGPRLLTTGPILNSAGPNQQLNHMLVETAEEAREAVRWQKQAGFSELKVYSNLKREPFEAILEEAAQLGMSVSGHPPEGFRAEGVPYDKPFDISFDEVLQANFHTIEHTESISWHGLSDRHDEAEAQDLAWNIALSGSAVTPTLLAFENLVLTAESKGAFAHRPGVEWLNPFIMSTETGIVEYWSSGPAEAARAHAAFLGQLTAMMQEQGVMLLAGSDAGIFLNPPGVSLLDELELLVRAGLSPYQALQTATTNVATLLGERGKTGCLGQGCMADLVLYECDPLADIACVRKPVGVVRAGRWYGRDALDAMLKTAAQPDVGRTAQNVLSAMEAQGTPIDPAALGQE